MQNFEAFNKVLNSARKVVITTHHKPDADALGSSLALAAYLKKRGHDVTVITPTDYADFLAWLPGNDEVVIFNQGNEDRSRLLTEEADLIFCLDFSCLERINELGDIVKGSPGKKVLIDHHVNPEDFADYKLWSVEAAATAELVHRLIGELGDHEKIDADIAECLYAGIMTDTGNFKHSNTTGNVFHICSDLVGRGADTAKVAKLIYDTNSPNRIKFLGYALYKKLKIIPESNTAYFVITARELRQFRSKTGDTEGLVNYALSLEGIKFAAVIIDRTEAVKMSFRSIGKFSANEFARNYFNGGGHRNAAGGISYESLENTVQKFEKLIKDNKEKLTDEVKILG